MLKPKLTYSNYLFCTKAVIQNIQLHCYRRLIKAVNIYIWGAGNHKLFAFLHWILSKSINRSVGHCATSCAQTPFPLPLLCSLKLFKWKSPTPRFHTSTLEGIRCIIKDSLWTFCKMWGPFFKQCTRESSYWSGCISPFPALNFDMTQSRVTVYYSELWFPSVTLTFFWKISTNRFYRGKKTHKSYNQVSNF